MVVTFIIFSLSVYLQPSSCPAAQVLFLSTKPNSRRTLMQVNVILSSRLTCELSSVCQSGVGECDGVGLDSGKDEEKWRREGTKGRKKNEGSPRKKRERTTGALSLIMTLFFVIVISFPVITIATYVLFSFCCIMKLNGSQQDETRNEYLKGGQGGQWQRGSNAGNEKSISIFTSWACGLE